MSSDGSSEEEDFSDSNISTYSFNSDCGINRTLNKINNN